MLVQSGRPVGVMQTHEWAPRVLIANSNLVPDWATWPEFRRLEHLGLTMYGQMTAGSWIYIGTQGILQGTYETFAAVAAKRFGGTLAGTLTVTGGCGGMGGAQPLAVTLNGGRLPGDRRRRDPPAAPGRPPLPRRGRRRPRRRDRALRGGQGGRARPLSVGLVGNCATVLPELLRRGVEVDIVTDQTSAHDPLSYLPEGIDLGRLARLRGQEARGVHRPGPGVDGQARRGDGRLHGRRRRGVRLRQLDPRRGPARAATTGRSPSPASCRPTSGRCSARARARSAGRRCPATRRTSRATDQAVLDLFPDNDHLHRWIRAAQDRVAFQGLPARICWLGYGERDKAGLALQRPGRLGRGRRRRSSSAATTSTAGRSPRRTARPRRWPTARTRSPTGRCSTRWSTPPPARPGCRSTTAAGSASAGRSTPGRSASPTAPSWPARSWSGC